MNQTPGAETRSNARLAGRLSVIALLMFGFGFAMVPLYDVFCEVTGLGGQTGRVSASTLIEVDRDRTVEVQFDATVHSGLKWAFEPTVNAMRVHPGELATVTYTARNTSGGDIIGQAVHNVSPAEASLYFNKTECFCYTPQLVEAGEERTMEVVFVVDPTLPEDIHVLTLAYTFFMNEPATQQMLATREGS